jgi:fructosamine-3-kinase
VTKALERALSSALDAPVARLLTVPGGDINDAFRVELSHGETLFAKTRVGAPSDMYTREAEGLAWLREACALRIPAVRAVESTFLLLEWIEPAARARDFDERLGAGLAQLHRSGAPGFGFDADNYIGSLPQANQPETTWSAFYLERRLLPLFRRAQSQGRLTGGVGRRFDDLCSKLPSLVGPAEPPSRLHGDLWSGNVHCDERGAPVLIDPAVYGGHREMDLAMLRLFGATSERFFHAYHDVFPLAPGHLERVALYQLYPLLVHVCLFGGAYAAQFDHTLQRALAVA